MSASTWLVTYVFDPPVEVAAGPTEFAHNEVHLTCVAPDKGAMEEAAAPPQLMPGELQPFRPIGAIRFAKMSAPGRTRNALRSRLRMA